MFVCFHTHQRFWAQLWYRSLNRDRPVSGWVGVLFNQRRSQVTTSSTLPCLGARSAVSPPAGTRILPSSETSSRTPRTWSPFLPGTPLAGRRPCRSKCVLRKVSFFLQLQFHISGSFKCRGSSAFCCVIKAFLFSFSFCVNSLLLPVTPALADLQLTTVGSDSVQVDWRGSAAGLRGYWLTWEGEQSSSRRSSLYLPPDSLSTRLTRLPPSARVCVSPIYRMARGEGLCCTAQFHSGE